MEWLHLVVTIVGTVIGTLIGNFLFDKFDKKKV